VLSFADALAEAKPLVLPFSRNFQFWLDQATLWLLWTSLWYHTLDSCVIEIEESINNKNKALPTVVTTFNLSLLGNNMNLAYARLNQLPYPTLIRFLCSCVVFHFYHSLFSWLPSHINKSFLFKKIKVISKTLVTVRIMVSPQNSNAQILTPKVI
jgi:hypothetical protein